MTACTLATGAMLFVGLLTITTMCLFVLSMLYTFWKEEFHENRIDRR